MGEGKSLVRRRLLLVHWNEAEAAARAQPLIDAGWQVEVEFEDGARAYRRVLDDPPAAIVIYLDRLPSHGRETAHALQGTTAGARVPTFFVGGQPDKVARVREAVPSAQYLDPGQLVERLAGLPKPGAEGQR